jgi:hypothetical protein
MKTGNPIIWSKKVVDFNDDDAVFTEKGNSIFIRARVHNIVEDVEGNIIDIYIQQGPEFYAISEKYLDFEIAVGDGIELKIKITNE